MKNSLLIFFNLILIFQVSAQTADGGWNHKTAVYNNSKHKITWQLYEDWEWVTRPVLTGSTLLKVRNDETGIVVSLGATKDNGIKETSSDAWDFIYLFDSPSFIVNKKELAKRNGMTYLGTKNLKSQICGIHAIKSRTDMKKDYLEYNRTVHSIQIEYYFHKRGYVYTLSITVLSILEDEIEIFDKIAAELFKGFSID